MALKWQLPWVWTNTASSIDEQQVLDLAKAIENKMPSVKPTEEMGASGTAVFGGYVVTEEVNPKIASKEMRYRTASDILANISIIAAGVRYFMNLVSKPAWTVMPADESEEAQLYADFVTDVMAKTKTSWPRIIRRCASYRWHGFSINEWIAVKRDDGHIGFLDIEPRPQHSIERWEVGPKGEILGVWQRPPQTGEELPIPRAKFVYMVDDMLTDSPEGMGWFRNLVEPAERMKAYLSLETIGFERDLSGTPVGRAPISLINKLVADKKITPAEGTRMIEGMKNFVRLEVKRKNTGVLIDSANYKDTGNDGTKTTNVPQWGIELLTGTPTSMTALGAAIDRLTKEMARIMGVESILVGSEGVGSLALSKDKSNNLYLQVNSTLIDMAGFMNKDFLDTLWMLNGFPEEMKPTMKTEDVAFKDVEAITAALKDLATAGAPMMPDDPVINAIRDLLGVPRADLEQALMDAMVTQAAETDDPENQDKKPGEEEEEEQEEEGSQ